MHNGVILQCENLVIDHGGRAVVSDLSFTTTASCVALLGDASGLFAAFSGSAKVTRGTLEVLGADARQQVIAGVLGLVTARPVEQPRWSGLELLTKSARLCGMSRSVARARAETVLEQLSLQMFGERPLGMLARAEHIALGIARALLSEPKVLAIETPFSNMGATASDWLSGLIDTAAYERHLIMSFDSALLEARSRIARFEELVVLRRGQASLVGAASELLETNCYFVCVTRGARALSNGLRGAGCQVTPDALSDESPGQLIVRKDSDALARVIVEVADELQVPVIELIALPVALSASSPMEDRAM